MMATLRVNIPQEIAPYTDVYFLRAKSILERVGLNPYACYQIFSRDRSALFHYRSVLELIEAFGDPQKTTVFVNGDLGTGVCQPPPGEPGVYIIAPVQSLIHLETVMLGNLCYANQAYILGTENIEPDTTTAYATMKKVVQEATDGVLYFGARHYSWEWDKELSEAAIRAGASNTSTLIGSPNQSPIGTIPHALEAVAAWSQHDREVGVELAAKWFNDYMPMSIRRIALVDYNNQEIDDTLKSLLNTNGLNGIRIDTCGENVMQSRGDTAALDDAILAWIMDPKTPQEFKRFATGRGVTIKGVTNLVETVQAAAPPLWSWDDISITLSSGFGNPDKVGAFVHFESFYGLDLFDNLGVGHIVPSHTFTADITSLGTSPQHMTDFCKSGRTLKWGSKLKKIKSDKKRGEMCIEL